MPTSPALVLGGTALGVAFLASRANRARRESAGEISSSSGHQVLDALLGPTSDPCLGAAYTEVAVPLLPEAYVNVSPAAQSLYGPRPVYFIPQNVQAAAFTRLAQLRVNEPFVEPVVKVAQELAPKCAWLSPSDSWSAAMIAFRDSLEKMVQVIDVDIGDVPALKRPHAWETEMVLRDGRSLSLANGSQVAFELPPGVGELALSATVTPEGAGVVETLGIHDHKLPDGNGSFHLVPAIGLRVKLANVSPAHFMLTATRQSGDSTAGTLDIYPKT
jgi:hypothetical protein